MIYLQLFLSFVKIGLFSFGGGYAMIPFIQREVVSHGWLTVSQLVDIIAIAEMTPGPIAVNSATFVGYNAAGLLGGFVATLGVSLPSMILVLIISGFFYKFQKKPANRMMFYGIRPVVVGLILSAALLVGETAFFNGSFTSVDFTAIFLFALSLTALIKFRLNPILIIMACGVLGLMLY